MTPAEQVAAAQAQAQARFDWFYAGRLDRSRNPLAHCFREDNCIEHPNWTGETCCCCAYPAEAHQGCDCE